jgi:hypothetical protein
LLVIQRDEGEGSAEEEDVFGRVIGRPGCRDSPSSLSRQESGAEESTDPEAGKGSSVVGSVRLGLSNVSSSLLGSRMTIKRACIPPLLAGPLLGAQVPGCSSSGSR